MAITMSRIAARAFTIAWIAAVGFGYVREATAQQSTQGAATIEELAARAKSQVRNELVRASTLYRLPASKEMP